MSGASPVPTSTETSDHELDRSADYSDDAGQNRDASFASSVDGGQHAHDQSFASSSLVADEDEAEHIAAIEAAMIKLKEVHRSAVLGEGWERVSKDKHGVDVYTRKIAVDVKGKKTKVPIYRGEKLVQGFTPQAVFNVAGQRNLWDDWYESGNLVEDLTDTTSLTYMVMNAVGAPARPRDVALVERVEVGEDGTVYFAATSVKSRKIPKVHGRARAHMYLTGFVLQPTTGSGAAQSTQMSYYVQIDPAGSLPSAIANRLITKRSVSIYKIAEYLKRNGSATPSDVLSAEDQPTTPSTPQHGSAAAVLASSSNAGMSGQANGHNPQSSSFDKTAGSGHLPPHVAFDTSASSSKSLTHAKQEFETLLSDKQWEKAVDNRAGSLIQYKKGGKSGIVVAKGELTLKGSHSTEQVLAVIRSDTARRLWDDQYLSSKMLENINGADQATWEDTFKGIHPHLEKQRYTTVKAALRSESESQDGDITYLATSTQSDGEQTSKATLAVSGWQIQHSNAGISLTHAAKFNPGVGPLPDFIERILVASEAGSPFKVKTFLDKYGHPPFFLRWGPGQARLGEEVRSSDSNLEAGKLAWRISADGPKSSGPQLAWLQWDRKMYPRGLELETDTADGLQIAGIDGVDNMAQITFDQKSASDMVLKAKPAQGDGPGYIAFNGQRVTQTISAPNAAALQRVKSYTDETTTNNAESAVAAAGVTRDGPINGDAPRENGATKQNTEALTSSAAAAAGGLAAVLPSKEQVQSIPKRAADLATLHHPEKLQDGRRALPDDAMLIITKDLYFTRSQMAVISALMAIVWAFTRFG